MSQVPAPEDAPRRAARAWPAIALGLLGGALVAVLVVPRQRGPTKGGAEAQAIFSLRELVAAQTLFRASDPDGDGVLEDAVSLAELRQAGLIDAAPGAGLRRGYALTLRAGPTGEQPRRRAAASPSGRG